MRYFILTTILDGELASSLHASEDEAWNTLVSAVGVNQPNEVQPFFDNQGVGWSFQITQTDPIVIDFTTFRKEMTESEFSELWGEAQERFGYVGTFFQRADADTQYAMEIDEENATLTDEQWESVQDSWYWRRGVAEACTTRGWDLVEEAVREATAGEEKS